MTATCTGEFSFNLEDLSDKDINAEFRRRNRLVEILRADIEENFEEKSPEDFSVAELQGALSAKGAEGNPWVFEVYRMVAEGRIDDALHAMQSEVPELAPPQHERAIADLLTGKRG